MGSTSYITDASGEVYQHLETEERGSQTPIKIIPNSEQYFAFGGTFVEEHSNTNRTPYLFNGKELDEETGLYYYGARYYDEQTSVWLSVDPHAERYSFQSPYVFVGNNPILNTEIDGNDYGIKVDHMTKSITISATYYASSSDIASAQQATSQWNNESGKHTYVVGKGDNAISYTVNFDLKAEQVDIDPKLGKLGSLSAAKGANVSGEGNVFLVVPDTDLPSNTNGSTVGGNFVKVKNSQKGADTGAHEIGHSLGIQHTGSGLMTPSSTDSKRSSDIGKNVIKSILQYPFRGKANSTNGRNSAQGRGTVSNVTPFSTGGNDNAPDQRLYSQPDKFHKGKVNDTE